MDLNADLGESFGRWSLGDDVGLMPHITSANIAAGFHATVIHADPWKLGQLRPIGDVVRFLEVTLEEAVELDRALGARIDA